MAITVTERAATEVKRIIADQKLEEGTLLRVGVTGGGCSGFSYSLGFDKAYDAKTDSKYQYHGLDVVVDKKTPCTWMAQPSISMRGSTSEALLSTILTPSGPVAAAARSRPDRSGPFWSCRARSGRARLVPRGCSLCRSVGFVHQHDPSSSGRRRSWPRRNGSTLWALGTTGWRGSPMRPAS